MTQFEIFAGIDWPTKTHQVAAVDADGEILGERTFAHSGEGLAEMSSVPLILQFFCVDTPAPRDFSVSNYRNRVKHFRVPGCAPFYSAPLSLAVILAEAFDSIRRVYLNALRSYFGVAPVTKRSGQAILVQQPLAANGHLRNAAYNWAMTAICRDKVSRANCHSLRNR